MYQERAQNLLDLGVKLPPAHMSTTLGGGITMSLFNAERQGVKLQIPIFMEFDLTWPGIKFKSNVSAAVALPTRPLIVFSI